MSMNSKNLPKTIKIPLKRCSNYWKYLKRISFLGIVITAILLCYEYIPHVPQYGFVYIATNYLQNNYWAYFGNIVLLYCWANILLRPRYLLIDIVRGKIYYKLPIIGNLSYYFVEVCAIQFETDMSQVLLRLKSSKIFRVYLKLYNGKHILVTEQKDEIKSREVCLQLQKIFELKNVEDLHRIGRKRGKKIQLGDYTIEDELSHGGMGKVFLAEHKKSKKKVALKILPICFALEDTYVTNFARETRILQRLSHKGIVKIFDVGRDKGEHGEVYFYAMEFIKGKSVSQLIKEKCMVCREIANLTLEIALALNYLHKHGVVHRDVKPSNIMVRKNGKPVLIDFGIARDISKRKPRGRRAKKKEITHYVGTLPYMSPEQISSQYSIDARTDLYSLGVTLYEMLTGEKPFRGGTQTVCRSILKWYPPEPHSINEDIPQELSVIAMRSIEKNKLKRYQSGAEFAEELHRFLHGLPIRSYRANWWARLWRKIRGFFRWI